MNLKIAVLSGDGIGPEVILQAKKALNAIAIVYDHEFVFEDAFIGAIAVEKTGNPLPEQTLNLCLNTDAVLFGTVGDAEHDNDINNKLNPIQGLLKLRQALGLYANIRPIKPYKDLLDLSPLKRKIIEDTDFIIFREISGGSYFCEKKINDQGTVASDLCEYTEEEIIRISHLAFKAAQKRKNKVTLVDKASILETSRLWRRTATEVAKNYPDVALEFLLVDNAAMQIIINPKQFDVILTENLFGDILSDEASVITGAIGLLPSASLGNSSVLFEPIHGSFAEAKRRNIANPIASVLSAAMLLEHFGLHLESEKVYEAVHKAIELNVVTADLNPYSKFGTNEVGDFISNYILSKDDLYFKSDNVYIGQSTIV
ncbi:3-isopropylmalate dehydrogenase [Flavobacterium sp. PL12]|uniref:3-isopropylmalate dehydrogenase n=1 Tax=Flavobacterium sp. PL12 TaxID=3071718 RepID=UPI00319DF325